MLLEVTTDTEKKEYKIRRRKEETSLRVFNEKMLCAQLFFGYYDAKGCDSACDQTKEILVELFKNRRKQLISKEKLRILSVKVPLEEDEIYTKEMYTSEWTSLLQARY